jgi:hypothetical protein
MIYSVVKIMVFFEVILIKLAIINNSTILVKNDLILISIIILEHIPFHTLFHIHELISF